jgi:hypothetical protein
VYAQNQVGNDCKSALVTSVCHYVLKVERQDNHSIEIDATKVCHMVIKQQIARNSEMQRVRRGSKRA